SLQFKANNLFQNLKEDNLLGNLSPEKFAIKAAQYYSDLNYLHPFREGNGRSIREFFRQLAGQSGHQLEWSKVSTEEYMNAVIKSNDPKQIHDLSEVILKCISKNTENELEKWIIPEKEIMLKEVIKL